MTLPNHFWDTKIEILLIKKQRMHFYIFLFSLLFPSCYVKKLYLEWKFFMQQKIIEREGNYPPCWWHSKETRKYDTFLCFNCFYIYGQWPYGPMVFTPFLLGLVLGQCHLHLAKRKALLHMRSIQMLNL